MKVSQRILARQASLQLEQPRQSGAGHQKNKLEHAGFGSLAFHQIIFVGYGYCGLAHCTLKR